MRMMHVLGTHLHTTQVIANYSGAARARVRFTGVVGVALMRRTRERAPGDQVYQTRAHRDAFDACASSLLCVMCPTFKLSMEECPKR